MNFSAVILAGGRSSRMGRDKACLEIGGQTLLARQIDLVRNAGAGEIFISGPADKDYSGFGCRVLRDKFPDAGPLAGIERALAAASSPLLLVLAVDLGRMTAEFLRILAAHCDENTGAIPCFEKNAEPLAAFYPKSAKRLILSMLEENSNSVKKFAELCVRLKLGSFVDFASGDKVFFENWNFPADVNSNFRTVSAVGFNEFASLF